MKKKKLDVVFIIDKSGSMSGSEDNTISSFNEYIDKERKNNYKTIISTILFSDNYHYLHNNIDINKITKLTRDEYVVGGCTALYDALGNAIIDVDKKNTDKVLFIIITDGYENASKEFNNNMIKKMIKDHKDYEFIYIGADIDSYTAGSNIGIKKANIANYTKDRTGTKKMFNSVGKFAEAMMMDKATCSWKEELEDYINDNKNDD